MRLNEKLYQLRKEKRLTQSELAEQLDVSRQSVSNWELGTVTPSTKKLKDLSRLYGVPLDYLLDDTSLEKPEGHTLTEETAGREPVVTNTPEKLPERPKWVWITAIIAIGAILLVLSVVAVVHKNNKDKEGVNKGVLLDEWSNEGFEFETKNDFDFN